MESIMNRSNVFSIIAAAILIAVAGTVFSSSAVRAQCTCSAGSLFGGSCTITCGVGFTCECSGGIFSASCRCVPIPKPVPYPARPFPLVPVSDAQIGCAQAFAAFLRELGTFEANGLADVVDGCVQAVVDESADAYAAAENNYVDRYNRGSEELRSAIARWLAAHPECRFGN
jgi:hypothetical protein